MQEEIINKALFELQKDIPDLKYETVLKSGKEAEVFIVSDNTKRYALKIYKSNTKFSSRLEYMNLNSLSRVQRKFIKSKSKRSKVFSQEVWTTTEFNVLSKIYNHGGFVPKPYAKTQDSILMELIISRNGPAPRLIDCRFNSEEAFILFDKIIFTLDIMLSLKLVHGDLSEYNILYDGLNPYIIDFPQMLYLGNNNYAEEKLFKDINNLKKFFFKYLNRHKLEVLNTFLEYPRL